MAQRPPRRSMQAGGLLVAGRLLVAALAVGIQPAAAYSGAGLALRRPVLPLQRAQLALCAASDNAQSGALPEPPPAAAAAPTSAPGRARAWLTKWTKFDREALGKLGVDAFFTYGLVSNFNAGLTISFAWFSFCQQTGLSPLAPGQWPKFLLTYGVIYATFGTVTRPLRMAFSVSVTPLFSAVMKRLQARMPFAQTRPKLNRTLTLLLFSVVGNMLCTFLLIAAGVWAAGIASGVPPFPAGARLPFSGRVAAAV
jgi:hypothetical protein